MSSGDSGRFLLSCVVAPAVAHTLFGRKFVALSDMYFHACRWVWYSLVLHGVVMYLMQ